MNQHIKIPSDVSFSNRIAKEYEERKKQLKEDLHASAKIMSLTTDSWTSMNTHSFTTITCHYINKDWEIKSLVLSTIHKKQDHTSDNIRAELEEILVVCYN